MAIHAEAHRVVDLACGYRLGAHVSVARNTIHSRADMGRMIELDVGGGFKAVHALPRHVLATIPVAFKLLNLRLVRGNRLMAGHTQIHARNLCVGPSIHARMTIDASQSFLEMNLMREGNRLNRRLSPAKILTNGRGNRAMCWSKNIVVCRRRRRVALRMYRRIGPKKYRCQSHGDEKDRNPRPHIADASCQFEILHRRILGTANALVCDKSYRLPNVST